MASINADAGLGTDQSPRLVELFGGVAGIFKASLTELEAAGLRAVSAQSLGTGRSIDLAQDEQLRAQEAGVTVISLDDSPYPSQLKQIYDPPVVLYVRGNVDCLGRPGIAVVGTRHPAPYGSRMAEKLAHELAARGLIIFSGLVRGVDTAGHRGAIAAGAFGTGVDVIYPKENSRLVFG